MEWGGGLGEGGWVVGSKIMKERKKEGKKERGGVWVGWGAVGEGREKVAKESNPHTEGESAPEIKAFE